MPGGGDMRIPDDRELALMERIKKLEAVVDAAKKWHETRTDYLIMVEIALSSHAPLEGGERYRAEAASSSLAASNLVAALHRLDHK